MNKQQPQNRERKKTAMRGASPIPAMTAAPRTDADIETIERGSHGRPLAAKKRFYLCRDAGHSDYFGHPGCRDPAHRQDSRQEGKRNRVEGQPEADDESTT